jgi:hypothetical protein
MLVNIKEPKIAIKNNAISTVSPPKLVHTIILLYINKFYFHLFKKLLRDSNYVPYSRRFIVLDSSYLRLGNVGSAMLNEVVLLHIQTMT